MFHAWRSRFEGSRCVQNWVQRDGLGARRAFVFINSAIHRAIMPDSAITLTRRPVAPYSGYSNAGGPVGA